MVEGNSPLENFVAEVHEDSALDGVEFGVFRLESKLADDWPLVSWIWRGGNVEASPDIGGRSGGDCRPLTPLVDHANLEIHVWHEDFEKCVKLRDAVLTSIWRYQGARFSVTDYEWFNEQDSTAEWATSGVKCIVRVIVELPISSEWPKTTKIVAHTKTSLFTDNPEGSTTESTNCD